MMLKAAGLDYGRKGPAPGTARRLVVLLHGYGADGADLLGLADVLGPHLPDAAFVAPNAPERCAINPMGYQWFPIPWIDGTAPEAAGASMARSFGILDRFLDEVAAAEGLGGAHTALVGFSQGTMMALHVGPRRADPPACIVGFSGRLLAPERLAEEAKARMPVLLVHGDADEVVPYASLAEAQAALEEAGFPVRTHTSRGMGHGIAPDGLAVALAFLKEHLPPAER